MRSLNPSKELTLQFAVVEEPAAGAGVADAGPSSDDAEALARRLFVAADDDDRARAHVLLFADDLWRRPDVDSRRMLRRDVPASPGCLARLGRRHRGRQVDQPLRIGGEAAHHFQRGDGVLFADRDVVVQPSGDDPLARSRLRYRARRRAACCAVSAGACSSAGKKWLGRLVVSLLRRHGNEFLLGITQRGQLAAKDAAGVDVDRAIQPFGFGHGRVAVHDHRLAAIFRGPVVAHRQTELVGFAGCFAEQREVAHRPEPRPCSSSFMPAWATTSCPSSRT